MISKVQVSLSNQTEGFNFSGLESLGIRALKILRIIEITRFTYMLKFSFFRMSLIKIYVEFCTRASINLKNIVILQIYPIV